LGKKRSETAQTWVEIATEFAESNIRVNYLETGMLGVEGKAKKCSIV
jgi:hypothetical protein